MSSIPPLIGSPRSASSAPAQTPSPGKRRRTASEARLAAERGLTATAVLRVNPDVDAGTHAKISTGRKENKFGVPIDTVWSMKRLSMGTILM